MLNLKQNIQQIYTHTYTYTRTTTHTYTYLHTHTHPHTCIEEIQHERKNTTNSVKSFRFSQSSDEAEAEDEEGWEKKEGRSRGSLKRSRLRGRGGGRIMMGLIGANRIGIFHTRMKYAHIDLSTYTRFWPALLPATYVCVRACAWVCVPRHLLLNQIEHRYEPPHTHTHTQRHTHTYKYIQPKH